MPSSGGISPESSFLPRLRLASLERFPNSAGILPVKPFPERPNPVTRPFWSTDTPYHSSKGELLDQLVLSSQLTPSVALYSATKALLSEAIERTGFGVAVAACSGSSVTVPVFAGTGVAVSVLRSERWGKSVLDREESLGVASHPNRSPTARIPSNVDQKNIRP